MSARDSALVAMIDQNLGIIESVRGNLQSALRHYQSVQEILRVELDAEPEPATTVLFQQIRLNPAAV